MKHLFTSIIILFIIIPVFAQTDRTAVITGLVRDAVSEAPIEFVTIYIKDKNVNAETATNGRYRIEVPVNEDFTLVFTRIGYKEVSTQVEAMPPRSSKQIDVDMPPTESGLEVTVRASKVEESGMIREDLQAMKLLPSTTGNLESILPSIALGTSGGQGGELTSQYNVRGGNYDENLVYVNDFEIYRPQLIRAGQQEGLTFANIDLIRDLSFSSGGFDAKYGDRLSSVLDIKYKRPDSLAGSFNASFLGGSAHIEGSTKLGKDSYRRFRY
ncbi:MAG: carboxypeptidase-like regulatory domain-containing protein, partial [Saprospiraceae bacterium]